MLAKCRYLQWVFILLFVIVSNSFAGGWEQVTELPTWRIGPAATAVKGKIYLIGGFDHHKNLGGRAPALSRVDVYDTQTNTWHTVAKMPTPRVAPQAAAFSNKIYVFGGYDRKGPGGTSRYKKTVEMYDPQTDTWVKKRDMPTLRHAFMSAVVDGKIYLIGGSVHDKKLDRDVAIGLVEIYDPLTNRWEKGADMPTERGATDAVVVDGKIYVIGGYNWRWGPLVDKFVTSIEEYNPKTDQWHELRDMPMLKFWFASVAIDNEIYTIGGAYTPGGNKIARISDVDVYNPTTNKWREVQALTILKSTRAVVVKGTIYALGGQVDRGQFSPIVEAYDTGFLSVDPKDKLLTPWGKLKAEHQNQP